VINNFSFHATTFKGIFIHDKGSAYKIVLLDMIQVWSVATNNLLIPFIHGFLIVILTLQCQF